MKTVPDREQQTKFQIVIEEFVLRTSGLKHQSEEITDRVVLEQVVDGRSIVYHAGNLEDVLERVDGDGSPFLQINFLDGRKILLTDSLIGFKPGAVAGIDLSRLPKVVTTPDLMSVFDAIHDLMALPDERSQQDLVVLRKICEAILTGGEKTGFNLHREKLWLLAASMPQVASA